MSLTLSQVDICNLALMKIGQRRIQSISDQTDANAIACRVAWNLALGSVSREAQWNCLATRKCLTQLPPAPDSCGGSNPASTAEAWAPDTDYAVNDLVTYAGQLYQCLIANTSSDSFTNDLTLGYWFETVYFWPNYLGPYPYGGNASPLYEWAYAYHLPSDYILLIELNGQNCWDVLPGGGNTYGSLYEIFGGRYLYCDTNSADIKYIRLETDTTRLDTLFIDCLTVKLAAMIATDLRKDNAELSQRMEMEYMKKLTNARRTNAGESNPRRYNIVSQSRFVASRYRSTNG